MKTRTVSTQGFELNIQVPETVEEYNGLAPKRENPCLEDAVQNTLYRSVFADFRAQLCEKLEEITGVKRNTEGEGENEKYAETEGAYIKRLLATVAQQRSLDPAAKATRDAIYAEWQPVAQSIIDGIKFDPSTKERTGGGGSLVAKTYIEWAGKAVDSGQGEKLAGLLSKALNRDVTLSGDRDAQIKTLSRAIADNEKRKRDEKAAQATAAGGFNVDALV